MNFDRKLLKTKSVFLISTTNLQLLLYSHRIDNEWLIWVNVVTGGFLCREVILRI
jgi:hypothetical protein